MARRSKAASRRERQKRRDRAPRRPAPPAPVPRAETRPATEAAATLVTEGRPPAPRPDPRTMQAGPSALGEGARAEYHYVGRELRSIGLLTVLMVIALIGAWVVFRLAGIGAG